MVEMECQGGRDIQVILVEMECEVDLDLTESRARRERTAQRVDPGTQEGTVILADKETRLTAPPARMVPRERWGMQVPTEHLEIPVTQEWRVGLAERDTPAPTVCLAVIRRACPATLETQDLSVPEVFPE